jgi:hypothetical protein
MSGLALKDQELTVTTLAALIGTPMFPDRYEDVPDALATLFVGREMGLPPMTALNHLYVVNGQVGMEGKTMLALIYRAGHKVHITLSAEKATVVAYRWDGRTFPHDVDKGAYYEAGVFEFTWEDAIRAGLSEKDNYQNYPTDMLGWKAVGRAARFTYPDIIIGGYNPEDVGYDSIHEEFPESVDIETVAEMETDLDEIETAVDTLIEEREGVRQATDDLVEILDATEVGEDAAPPE